MTTYRDYPSPDRLPNYLHNSRNMEYLRMYAQHFDLTKHIRFLVSGAGNTQHMQNLLGRVQNQAKWGAARHRHSILEGSPVCLSGGVSRTFHPYFLLEKVWWVGWKRQTVHLVLAHRQLHSGPQLGTCWLTSLLKKVLVGKPAIKKLRKPRGRVAVTNLTQWGQKFWDRRQPGREATCPSLSHSQSKVHSVRKRSDFSCKDVLVETTGKQESYVFDGIMVCSGLYTEPILPLQNFPGMSYGALRHWRCGVLSLLLLLFSKKVRHSESHPIFKRNVIFFWLESNACSYGVHSNNT